MADADAYFTPLAGAPASAEWGAAADRVFAQVFRRDFAAPGVALVSFGPDLGSAALRRSMESLKEGLGERYRALTGRRLGYLSLGRFNQQTTTRFHLDGSPDEAYLMLGYEPTAVASELYAADYTRAARDWGIAPKVLLAERNPMYGDHERRLTPYATRLEAFDPGAWQIVLFNNSSLPFEAVGFAPQGVMHKAVVPRPDPGRDRVVDSTMIVPLADGAEEAVGPEALRAFLETMPVAGGAAYA